MKKIVVIVIVLGLLSLAAYLTGANPVAEVRGKTPAQPLSGDMSPEQQLAQDLALSDPQVQAYTLGHRSEVFGVRQVIAGQYTKAASACGTADCRQVEIYNWDENVAFSILVNIDSREVLDVLRQPGMHPGINKRLHDLSIEIATNAPEVIEALGYRPSGEMALAAVDADLLGSSCTGEHLCIGATFPVGTDRILWAIVDLTEETLAGTYWTDAIAGDDFVPFAPTGCPAPGSVNRDGWTLDYANTAWDSMNVSNIAFNGAPVATSIKLVEWHADYGASGFRDSTGCQAGGGGFTIFPYGETQVLDLLDGVDVIGFEVVQDFRMGNWGASCNYRYEQRLRFFDDGRFRVVSGAYGKGCGTNAIYRPVVRIDIAVKGEPEDSFSRWNGSAWEQMTTEDYLVPYVEAGHGPHEIDADGYSWRIDDTGGSALNIIQDVGQYDGDAGRGAEPFLYPTLHHANEGDTDLPVIASSCCNDNHEQGPDQFLNGENIQDQNIVLWYVPQTETDVTPSQNYCWTVAGEPTPETYPCFAGPMFVPAGLDATFNADESVILGATAVFTNTTFGAQPITYEWDFGDGVGTSTDTNPTYVYASPGVYTVTLTATNIVGTQVSQETININAEAPTAAFDHNGPIQLGNMAQFTNLTTATGKITYEWDFGDGSAISSDENPSHLYKGAGSFTVTLTATNAFGLDVHQDNIQVFEPGILPTADFFHPATALVNTAVSFTNLSNGAPPLTYDWDFGDSSAHSTDENPLHTYTITGTFTITLTATNNFGSHMTTSMIEITEVPPNLDQAVYIPFVSRE